MQIIRELDLCSMRDNQPSRYNTSTDCQLIALDEKEGSSVQISRRVTTLEQSFVQSALAVSLIQSRQSLEERKYLDMFPTMSEHQTKK